MTWTSVAIYSALRPRPMESVGAMLAHTGKTVINTLCLVTPNPVPIVYILRLVGLRNHQVVERTKIWRRRPSLSHGGQGVCETLGP